ncbi:MAG TPA: SRPBCC family protein [Acidimicrobiales bacterium]|jgi:hypothetical protein
MELTNEFRVGVPIDEAWALLTDVEGIAPCMPGAELQEVDGDEFRGVVRVKVGPITAQYKGVAQFIERDDASYRAVLRAEGRETRGQGNASATVTAQLSPDEGPDGPATKVSVVTDLVVTGRVAQFGRGVLADISAKLLTQFVDCLEHKLHDSDDTNSDSGNDGQSDRAATSGPATSPKPVDLLGTAGGPVLKRLLPIGLAVSAVLWLFRRSRRRRRRRRRDG